MGCGRVGSTLARSLEDRNHTVSVIDSEPDSFRRLGPSFNGDKITGYGFDQAVLEKAGIRRADAFAAVSSGDNSNIIAARVARETFGIQQVVARIYDPGRAEIYQRLGIPTVAAVRWSTDQVLRRILPDADLAGDFRDASGRIVMAEVRVAPGWIGRPVTELEAEAGVRVAFLTRMGEGTVPSADTLYQQGDIVHAVLAVAGQDEAERILATDPQTGTERWDEAGHEGDAGGGTERNAERDDEGDGVVRR